MSISQSLSDVIRREMAPIMPIGSGELQALEDHYRLILKWNPKMNLTTVTKVEEAAIRHYCESLFLAVQVRDGSVVDVGSGPGFPGIPLAVVSPACGVALVESHQRKAVFLREAVRDLPNARVISERAESLTGRYDWLVSRAVDPGSLMKLRIAGRYALLLGADDALQLGSEQIVPLPWGDRRVLAIGAYSDSCST